MSAENKKDILKMAMIYAQEGRWDKAITEYKKLLTLDPTDYSIHNMLGDVYAKKGEDALAYQAYITAAEAYAKQGLADKSSIIYKKIGKLNSDKLPEADKQKQVLIKRNTIAEKFIEEGNVDKAIEEYKEILKINPANFDTYQKLGELFTQKGDHKEALAYYKKIVDDYFKNRLYKKALPIYQKILEIQPDSIATREKIAEIYEREGNESDAKREYLYLAEYYWNERNIEKTDFFAQKAVDFKSIEAHYFKGAALVYKKEYGEAKKELDMLLKFKANHIGALVSMAEVYRELNQMDEAIAMLNKVIKAEPENIEGYLLLGDIYLKKGLKKDAAVRFLSAVNIFVKKNEKDKAAELLKKVLEQDQDNIELLGRLAEIYIQANKKKEAADVYLKISEIFGREKMPDKEQENYKLAVEIFPSHPVIVDKAKKLGMPQAAVKPETDKMPTFVRPETVKSDAPALETMIRPAQSAPVKTEGDPPKIQRGYIDMMAEDAAKQPPPPAPTQHVKPKADVFLNSLPDLSDFSLDAPAPVPPPKAPPVPASPAKTATAPAPQPEPRYVPEAKPIPLPVPEFNMNPAKKPSEQIKEMETAMGLDNFADQQTKEDVPSMIAMADSLVKMGSFDEAIENYQKALVLDPGNEKIKAKLNMAYSQYAGVPLPDPAVVEAEHKRKLEIEKSRKIEEEKRKKEYDEMLKKDAENKKDQDKDRKDKDTKEKVEKEKAVREAEEKNKKEAEERKKNDEEEKKKKSGEEAAKKKAEAEHTDTMEEPEISDDFVTVTTAEIFMKQGLLTEADKILKRILAKDAENMEARMRLDELKKLLVDFPEEETKPVKGKDEDKGKGSKGSKVSYI